MGKNGFFKEMLAEAVSAVIVCALANDNSPFVTKWGTVITPLPKGAVLLENRTDTFQWKRRWQQTLPNGAVIEYVETDDAFGYAKRSRIIKK